MNRSGRAQVYPNCPDCALALPNKRGKIPEQELVQARITTLEEKIEAGVKNALLAPPTAVEDAWALVAKWKDELEQTKNRLALLDTIRSNSTPAFFEWWESIKEKLVHFPALCHEPVYDAESDWTEKHHTQEPVMCDQDTFRAILFRLGFEVRLWWKHDAQARLHDRTAPSWTISKKQIGTKISLDSFEHSVAGGSSRCNRARSRSRD